MLGPYRRRESIINASNSPLTAVPLVDQSVFGITISPINGVIDSYQPFDIADFIILKDTVLTPEEARQLFLASNNSGTGATAGDYSQYPAAVINNRILHVPGNKTLAGPARLEDISGYNNHLNILGTAGVDQNPFY